MDIQGKIRAWLGVTKLIDQSVSLNRELAECTVQLGRLRDEDLRLRQMIADKFADLAPASPEFIDHMRQQLEMKIDIATGTIERAADAIRIRVN